MKNTYVLLLLLSIVCLYPSEKMQCNESESINQLVEAVRDSIDEEILGISKNAFLRSIRGLLWSFVHCNRLYKMQMVSELQKIESYIPESSPGDRQLIFKKLIARHAYFYWLMDCIVEFNLKLLDLVCGLRIDAFNEMVNKPFKGLSQELNSFISSHIKKRYAGLHSQIIKRFQDIPFNTDFDIHHMPLRAHHVIEKIDLSHNGDYVLGSGATETTIWNIHDGKIIDISQLDAIKWRNNTDPYMCENDRYCIINGKDLPLKKTWNCTTLAIAYEFSNEMGGRVLSLFTRPTYESQLCQNTLYKGYGSSSNLRALASSHVVEQLQEDFPKLRLKNAIDAQLKKLK